MKESLTIPADMNDREGAREIGAKALVSIRDMLILLGASDQTLRDMDERDEILAREPWRKDSRKFVPCGPSVNGGQCGYYEGEIDWSGTRFGK